MSLPIQELCAQLDSYRFLIGLMRREDVPEQLRREARILTKHYPYESSLVESALASGRITADEVSQFRPELRRKYPDLLG